jgi:hypothetical protein
MERRNTNDRRSGDIERERSFPFDRRKQPDRRLNNICLEWMPAERAVLCSLYRLIARRK